MEAKTPNVDLPDPAFYARVISVLEKEKKKERKQRIMYAVYFIFGALFLRAVEAFSFN
jgi:hypothetical protein